jgi:hypothetical protein
MYKFEGQITHLRELFTNRGSYGMGQYIAYGQIGHYGQVVRRALITPEFLSG